MKNSARTNAVPSAQPVHDRRGSRSAVIRSLNAAGLGVVAKAIGLFNQIASVALISSSLGSEGLQEQLLAISFVGWFYLTLCGMQTSLPVLLIRSRSDTAAFAATAKTAFLFAAIAAGSIGWCHAI